MSPSQATLQRRMDEAIQLLFKACVGANCFPGTVPQLVNGKIPTQDVLEALGLLESSQPVDQQLEAVQPTAKPLRKRDTTSSVDTFQTLDALHTASTIPPSQADTSKIAKTTYQPQSSRRHSTSTSTQLFSPKTKYKRDHNTISAAIPPSQPISPHRQRPQTQPSSSSTSYDSSTFSPPCNPKSHDSQADLRAISSLPIKTAKAIQDMHPYFANPSVILPYTDPFQTSFSRSSFPPGTSVSASASSTNNYQQRQQPQTMSNHTNFPTPLGWSMDDVDVGGGDVWDDLNLFDEEGLLLN